MLNQTPGPGSYEGNTPHKGLVWRDGVAPCRQPKVLHAAEGSHAQDRGLFLDLSWARSHAFQAWGVVRHTCPQLFRGLRILVCSANAMWRLLLALCCHQGLCGLRGNISVELKGLSPAEALAYAGAMGSNVVGK